MDKELLGRDAAYLVHCLFTSTSAGSGHQSVVLTRSQLTTGILSVPTGRAQSVWGVLPSCSVVLRAADGTAFTLLHKCYPSSSTQIFLHGLCGECQRQTALHPQ